jgi:hypothetical protein
LIYLGWFSWGTYGYICKVAEPQFEGQTKTNLEIEKCISCKSGGKWNDRELSGRKSNDGIIVQK